MAVATKIQLPYLKIPDLTGRNYIHPKNGPEDFGTTYINIKQILTGETVSDRQKLEHKRTRNQTRYHLIVGDRDYHKRLIQHGSRYNQNRKTNTVIPGKLHAKKTPTTAVTISSVKNQKTMRHPKTLEKANNCTKKLRFQRHKTRRPLTKFITSITDKKLPDKLIREKTLNLKTTVELVAQNSFDRRHKQSTIPSALPKDKEIMQEPVEKFQAK